MFFFFFQAEDGIRDGRVTGVQTCALPIWDRRAARAARPRGRPVQVEAVGPAEAELRQELLPTRREHVAPCDEAGDHLGVLGAADVGAGVAEPPQYGDRSRRALEPGAEPAVGAGALALDERQELGRDP